MTSLIDSKGSIATLVMTNNSVVKERIEAIVPQLPNSDRLIIVNYRDHFSSCTLCPHRCGIDRNSGERGICGETAELRLASAGLHFGEEPPLSGRGGSGTIFITGCSMSCPFCQNHQISCGGIGRAVDSNEFVEICLGLQNAGAENLNLVTPSHMAPTLSDFIDDSREAGVVIPVAWNSSGFESVESVKLAGTFVDIWLPDLKTLDDDVSRRIYSVEGYPETSAAALLAMADFGSPELDSEGRMIKGLMVRHLVLPGEMSSTRRVLEWFERHLAGRAWLSLMTQYTPVVIPGETRSIPERQLRADEYEMTLEWLHEFSIDDGFIQDLVPGDEWLPDFRRANPFSSDLSRILWRWDTGFVRD